VHPLTSYVVYYIKRLFELHERAPLDTLLGGGAYSAEQVANRDANVWHGAAENGP
jgi:hypothetical protein